MEAGEFAGDYRLDGALLDETTRRPLPLGNTLSVVDCGS